MRKNIQTETGRFWYVAAIWRTLAGLKPLILLPLFLDSEAVRYTLLV